MKMISIKKTIVSIVGAVFVFLITLRLIINTVRFFGADATYFTVTTKVTTIIEIIAYASIVVFLVLGIFYKVSKFAIIGIVVNPAVILFVAIFSIVSEKTFENMTTEQIVVGIIELVSLLAIIVFLALYFFNKTKLVFTLVSGVLGFIIYFVSNIIMFRHQEVNVTWYILPYIREIVFSILLYSIPIIVTALDRKEDGVNL